MEMKRIPALVLALLLITSMGASAHAQALPQAAVVDLNMLFEKYASYQVDENGQWSASNIAASQLLKSAEAGSVKSSMSGGSCLLIPSIRGDAQRSYAEIVLHIYLFRTAAVKAMGVSIVVGDVRYDFVANATAEKVGIYSCERFDIPLNADGLAMLRGIADNGCAIYIYGSDKPYQATIESADSLTAIRALLDELPEQYLSDYSLWAENAARWSDGRPGMAVHILSDDEYSSDMIAPFDLLKTDDKDAVKRMQQLLFGAGFYVGKVDGKHGDGTRAAVRDAQRYYGLLQTGLADRTLIDLLSGGQTRTPEEVMQSEAIDAEIGQTIAALAEQSYRCEGSVQIRIDRSWYARKLTPTQSLISADSGELASITPGSAGNYLLIADGIIQSIGDQTAFLPLTLEAEIIIGGEYVYPCAIRCEKQSAENFDTTLLPLETARIILYAEVPKEVMDMVEIALSMTITSAGGEISLQYDIETP